MNLTSGIQRHSSLLALALTAFAIWAFWPNYFSRNFSEVLTTEHIHGITMFAWCLLLAFQGWLIRSGRRSLHRSLGKLSYALVPVIAVSTLMLGHQKLGIRGLESEGPLIFALQFFLLAQFLVIYALAIAYRRQPAAHARYMASTLLPMIDPVFNRLLSLPLAKFAPILADLAIPITFSVTFAIPLTLMIIDRKAGYREPVFRNVLVTVTITLFAILALLFVPPWSELWLSFCSWYLSFPLTG